MKSLVYRETVLGYHVSEEMKHEYLVSDELIKWDQKPLSKNYRAHFSSASPSSERISTNEQ